VDLPLALDQLAELGIEQVLCEGGPALLHAALLAGVVDELDLSISPSLVGTGPRLLDGALPGVVRSRLLQLLEEDGTLFARYAVAPGAR
jgi:riboflavin biosynthesis pyrimidine reductase